MFSACVCVCMHVCISACMCHMFSLMQRSEVHSNAAELTTWDHQIRMIYSPELAYTVSGANRTHI